MERAKEPRSGILHEDRRKVEPAEAIDKNIIEVLVQDLFKEWLKGGKKDFQSCVLLVSKLISKLGIADNQIRASQLREAATVLYAMEKEYQKSYGLEGTSIQQFFEDQIGREFIKKIVNICYGFGAVKKNELGEAVVIMN